MPIAVSHKDVLVRPENMENNWGIMPKTKFTYPLAGVDCKGDYLDIRAVPNATITATAAQTPNI